MKLARFGTLALAAMSLAALNGCTTVWSQGHIYTESTPPGAADPQALSMSVDERNAMKKFWDDEAARQSQRRLQTYW